LPDEREGGPAAARQGMLKRRNMAIEIKVCEWDELDLGKVARAT
jgi:hypothetical protein